MRVIAGTAKRLQLKTLDGMETRPTTDRDQRDTVQYDRAVCFRKRFSGLVCRKWRNWHRGIEQRRQRGCFCRKESKKRWPVSKKI